MKTINISINYLTRNFLISDAKKVKVFADFLKNPSI